MASKAATAGSRSHSFAASASPSGGASAATASKPAFLRLRCRAEFLRVQTGGRRFRGQHMVLIVAPLVLNMPLRAGRPGLKSAPVGRLGLTVSKKVGNAVVRNRIRRILREAWRLGPGIPLADVDHVLIAYPQAAEMTFATAREELACLLKSAHAWACSRKPAMRSLPCTG